MSEMIFIGVVVLVLFGARRIPEFMRGLGQGIREFKDAANTVKRDITEEQPKPQAPTQLPGKTLDGPHHS